MPQGVLYVWGSQEARSSSTVVWPGSHHETYQRLMRDPAMQARGHKGVHFSPLVALDDRCAREELLAGWYSGGRRVTVPPGALLLWDSRVVHQGWSGGPRLAQPVCWEPVHRRSASAYERKLRLAALGLPSTHWASLGQPHYLVAAQKTPEVGAGGNSTSGGGQGALPFSSSLKPLPLCEHAVCGDDMWQALANFDRAITEEQREELEQMIKPEFKAIL